MKWLVWIILIAALFAQCKCGGSVGGYENQTTDCTPIDQNEIRCTCFESPDACSLKDSIEKKEYILPDVTFVNSTRLYLTNSLNIFTKWAVDLKDLPSDVPVGYQLVYEDPDDTNNNNIACRFIKIWRTSNDSGQNPPRTLTFNHTLSAINSTYATVRILLELTAFPSGSTSPSYALVSPPASIPDHVVPSNTKGEPVVTSTARFPAVITDVLTTPAPDQVVPSNTKGEPGVTSTARIPVVITDGITTQTAVRPSMSFAVTYTAPFQLEISFRRLIENGSPKHDYYRVNINRIREDGAFVMHQYINKTYIPAWDVTELDPEYVKKTFEVMPGPLRIEIRCYIKSNCWGGNNCDWATDPEYSTFRNINITGAVYNPDVEPKVEISKDGSLSVMFKAAPSNYRFTQYLVQVINKSFRVVAERLVYGESNASWHTVTTTIAHSELQGKISPGDPIHVQVIPVTDLCEENMDCNTNGICGQCKASLSKSYSYKAVSEDLNWLWAVGTGCLFIIICSVILLYFRNRWCRSKLRKLFIKIVGRDPSLKPRPVDTLTIGDFSGAPESLSIAFINASPQTQVMLAYTSDKVYANFSHAFSKLLTQYFNCSVFDYNETQTSQEASVVLVICSPLLYECQGILEDDTPPACLSKDLIHATKILRFLCPNNRENLDHVETVKTALVTFEGCSENRANKLSTSNPRYARPVFCLPTDLERLACYLEGENSKNARHSRYGECSSSKEYKNFLDSISHLPHSRLSGGLDSGFGSDVNAGQGRNSDPPAFMDYHQSTPENSINSSVNPSEVRFIHTDETVSTNTEMYLNTSFSPSQQHQQREEVCSANTSDLVSDLSSHLDPSL